MMDTDSGKTDVYCPWDVINYCSDHIEDPYLPPQNYWLNTSGNEMIYHFIDGLEDQTGSNERRTGTSCQWWFGSKNINQELTYKELYSSMDNLWEYFVYDRVFNAERGNGWKPI